MKTNKKAAAKFVLTVVCTAAVTVALTLTYIGRTDRLGRLRRVISIIDKDYIGEFDAEKAEKAAIESVVESLGDKYSAYYEEEDAEQTLNYINGYYIGVGLEIFANTENDTLEVISAYEGSPAYKAGIKSGDVLYTIDKKRYGAKKFAKAAAAMRGTGLENPVGTKVEIVVLRGEEKLTFNIERENIELDRVESKTTADGLCYIRYSGFAENSEKKLEKIVNSVDKTKISGIVVDLRDNPGGEFDSSINMSDLFLKDGVIMYTEDKKGNKTVYKAKKDACDLPLAVLVNGSSASASEIFAGAMKARGRGIIVGEKSYGKGVSQSVSYINVFDKSDGALKLTVCKNFLSDGTWLNSGVMPDIEAQDTLHEIGDIENDKVYRAAAEALKNKSGEKK